MENASPTSTHTELHMWSYFMFLCVRSLSSIDTHIVFYTTVNEAILCSQHIGLLSVHLPNTPTHTPTPPHTADRWLLIIFPIDFSHKAKSSQ